jgi:type IV secretion system protein VirD4
VSTINHLAAWHAWMKVHGPYCLGGALALLLLVWLVRGLAGRRQRGRDARWASRRDLRNAYLLGDVGIVVGRIGGTILRYWGRGHVFVVAATQSGKSKTVAFPTCLETQPTKRSQPKVAMVINDPKGELVEGTSRHRETCSRVIRLNPCSRTSDGYNPFEAVRFGTDHAIADLQLLAQMFTNPEGWVLRSESERHFVQMTEIALQGLIAYGVETGQGACPGELYTLVTQGLLTDAIKDMAVSPDPVQRAAGELLTDMDDKQFSNVKTTLMRTVDLYADPLVAKMTARSDFCVEELRQGPQPLTVYVSVPFADQVRMQPLTTLVFRQWISRSLGVPQTWHREGYHKLLVLGEEFPSLKRLQIAAETMNQGAGLGVQLCLIVPSLNSIEEIWGMHHNFLDNAHVQVFFGITDGKVAERVSDRIGTQTVVKQRISYGRTGRSVTWEEVPEPLLSASAITHMDPDALIVLARDQQVIAQQCPWDQWKPWRDRGVTG